MLRMSVQAAVATASSKNTLVIIEDQLSETANHSTYSLLKREYEKNLKGKGVKLPTEKSSFGQALCCLYEKMRSPVHIIDIRSYVENKGITLPGGGDSLQVRHLGLQHGFNLLKGGDKINSVGDFVPKSHYMLLDLENTYPGFHPKRRAELVSNDVWALLKSQYDNKCVNCGCEEDEPMRWEPNKITKLQQGHMDPRMPLTLNNVIPQCSFCNQQYKNKAVFNTRGVVIEFNKEGFVCESL